jgi:serine/threonine-protein kinase
MAWEGSLPGDPGTPIRIEAAAYRGGIVSFRVVEPWSRPERMEPVRQTSGQRIAQQILLVFVLILLASALLLARKNLMLGRGDPAGAFKAAGFFIVVRMIAWILWSHHVPDLTDEWRNFLLDTGHTLFYACLFWILYMGLEPLVRRRWPDTIISWTRVLSGRFRNPRVGRDILVGGTAAAGFALLGTIDDFAPGWLGWAPPLSLQQDAIQVLGRSHWGFALILVVLVFCCSSGSFFGMPGLPEECLSYSSVR